MLPEEVPGDIGGIGVGVVPLEDVNLVTDKIWHNFRSNDLIQIPDSHDTITSEWVNILKDHMSCILEEANVSTYLNVLSTP